MFCYMRYSVFCKADCCIRVSVKCVCVCINYVFSEPIKLNRMEPFESTVFNYIIVTARKWPKILLAVTTHRLSWLMKTLEWKVKWSPNFTDFFLYVPYSQVITIISVFMPSFALTNFSLKLHQVDVCSISLLQCKLLCPNVSWCSEGSVDRGNFHIF